jgi:ArsR family metal-binding transcriptional regulator
MTNFFKNTYDPSLEDIRELFPNFNYNTKETWLELFQDNSTLTPQEQAKFAYKKLNNVTTSFKLEDIQKTNLQKLILGEGVDSKTGWEAYCHILDERQIDYVGY